MWNLYLWEFTSKKGMYKTKTAITHQSQIVVSAYERYKQSIPMMY